MEDGGVTRRQLNLPRGRKGGLLPPGPCSPRGYRHPWGWGRGGGRAAWPARRKPRASPEVVLRALARESRGWGSRRVPSSSGTAGLGHVLQSEESGTRARRPGRGAMSRGPGAGGLESGDTASFPGC